MSGVLLTDAQQRKTLAAARSLGGKGIKVYIGENTRLALSSFSKYCHRPFVYPSPRSDTERFLSCMFNFIKKYRPDVFFPMDDDIIEAVAGHLKEFKKLTRVPIPEQDKLAAVGDKASLIKIAGKAGTPCPKTVSVNDLGELGSVLSCFDFPVVIKPRKSSGSRGIRYIFEKKDFIKNYLAVHKEYPFPVVQEFIPPGEKYDVCLLFNQDSKLRAAFVQKELRQYPLEGGPSTLQESVYRPDLIELALDLMKDTGWYGVAEVEFMVDPRDGLPKLMEVNPRFWASLQASISAGIDFPYLLYRLAVDGDIEPHFNYRSGVRCRWLLPGDILHFLFNSKRLEMDPGFFQFRSNNLFDDIISRDDPGAVLGFCLGALRCAVDYKMWRKVIFR